MRLEEIFVEGSSIFIEARKKAVAKARETAAAEGRIEGARQLLQSALADRFPGLEEMPELGRIVDTADLRDLLISYVTRSDDRASVRQAIVDAAQRASPS